MSSPVDIKGPFESAIEAWENLGKQPGPLSQVFFMSLPIDNPEKAAISNDLSYAKYPAEVIPRKR